MTMEALTTFQKELEVLRELYNKGAEADPTKFDNLAKSMIWDLQANFSLPLSNEQMEFVKMLEIAEASGDYWHGVGWALTVFLVPLGKLHFPANMVQPIRSVAEPVVEGGFMLEDEQKVEISPSMEDPKKSESPKSKFILD